MRDLRRKPKSRTAWTSEHDAAVERIAAAAQRAERSCSPASRAGLTEAVDAARMAGVGWTKIGDTLGIASGNAYRRYRKRPDSTIGEPTRMTRLAAAERYAVRNTAC